MWILPKNHPLFSVYAQDSCEDLKSELSIHYSENYTLPLMRKSKPLSLKTFYAAWKRVFWMRHLSGRILKLSLSNYFGAKYTASLEGIHASHFQLPVIKKEQKTQDTCGLILKKESRQLDLFSASSKTSEGTSILDIKKSEEAFKDLVTRLGKESIRRKKLARHTEEIGYSYLQSEQINWLAPECSDRRSDKSKQQGLSNQVKWVTPTVHQQSTKYQQGGQSLEYQVGAWQIPQARDYRSPDLEGSGNYERKKEKGFTIDLNSQVMNWTTPTTAEANKIGNQANYGQKGLSNHPAIVGETNRVRQEKSKKKPIVFIAGLQDQDKINIVSKSRASLNPAWVLSLMGTDLEKIFYVEPGME